MSFGRNPTDEVQIVGFHIIPIGVSGQDFEPNRRRWSDLRLAYVSINQTDSQALRHALLNKESAES